MSPHHIISYSVFFYITINTSYDDYQCCSVWESPVLPTKLAHTTSTAHYCILNITILVQN